MSVAETTPPEEAIESTLMASDRWWSWSRHASVLGESAVTAVLAVLVFVLGFGGNLRRLAGPLGSGDIVPAYVIAKFWSDGSPFGNSSIGYPFGTELRYSPTTDFFQNAIGGVVSAVFHNPFIGLNVVFVLSFPATALAALWVFRMIGVRGPIAIFTSLAFTAIPFHWLRLEHIYLATTFSAVLGVGLAILTGTGEFERRLAGRRRWPTVALLVTLSILIAGSGIYYACFSILLCLVAWVYRLAHRPSWRVGLVSAIPVTNVIFFTGTALIPAFLFLRNHPALHVVVHRQAIESVIYSGNLAFALTPAPFTQLPILKSLNPRIENAFAVANSSGTSGVSWYSNFGSLFTVLALLLAGVGLFWSVRHTPRDAAGDPGDLPLPGARASYGLVGLLLGTTVLFFVPWGLNVLFAAIVTPEIRAWDRLVSVILLLFFAGAMVAWRTMRLPQKGLRAHLIAAGCLVVLVFDSVVPYQAQLGAIAATGQEARHFGTQYAAALNAAIPGRCAMLEIPYQSFPEEPNLLALPVYDAFWPALTNPEKEWTFGAMKGTLRSEWERVLGSDIDASAVSDLVAGGFCGIHVDRRGLTTEENTEVSARLVALLGAPVATGHSGDWTAYALPPVGSENVLDVAHPAALPEDVATFYYPPDIEPKVGDTTVGTERDAFGPWWRATSQRTDLAVRSLEPAVKFREVSGTIQAGDCAPRDVTVELATASETVTTSFHLAAGEQHDFILKLGATATNAELFVTAAGALCTNADKSVSTVAIHEARAR